MKTNKLLLKAALWLAFLFIGQTAWATQWVNTSGFTEGVYNATCFVNDSTVYAVGGGGSILKSTNGGNTWGSSINNTGLISTYYAVSFTSDSVGYAAGINGDMVKTTDAGATWTSLTQSYQTNYTYGMSFPSKLIGYQVGYGGVIIKTTDAGATWTKQTSGITTHLRSVCFLNDTLGYACGLSGKILKTTDGGTTWTVLSQTLATGSLYCITFKTANLGYVVGASGKILKTTDGGANWTLQTSPVTSTLYSAYFMNDTTVYAAGNLGVVLKTTNGGTKWTTEVTDATSILYSIEFNKTGTHGVIAGLLGYIGKQVSLSLSKDSLSLENSAVSGSILVSSNTSWTASTTASWITLSQSATTGNGNLLVTASTNTSVTARVDTVYVAASGLSTLKIVVTQQGASPVVSLSSKNASYTYPATTVTVPVTANTTFSATTAADWIQLSNITGTSFDLSLSENTTYANRWDTISVSVAGGNTAKIAIIQGAAPGSYASISCTRDNTIIQSSTGTLGNSLGAIYVGRTNQGTGVSIRRGLIYFDIATNVPANAVIDSVRLSLYQIGSVKNATVNLHKVLSDWTEGTSFFDGGKGATATAGDVTWLSSSYPGTSWTTAGGDFDATVSGSKKSLVEIESGRSMSTFTTSGMATDVQYWLANSSSNYGWLLQGDETVAGNAEGFRSKDGTDRSYNSPLLKVYYSTSPTTGTSTLAQSDFSIYPNPASTYTIVTLSGKCTEPIRIYNLCGSLVKVVNQGDETQVNVSLSGLQTGVYLVKAGRQTARLIVK